LRPDPEISPSVPTQGGTTRPPAAEACVVTSRSEQEIAALLCDGKTLPQEFPTIHLVQRVLATLDARTRAVLVQTVLQRQRSPGHNYMARGSAAALAERWATTTVNIRRIRRAGLRALVTYVRENSA